MASTYTWIYFLALFSLAIAGSNTSPLLNTTRLLPKDGPVLPGIFRGWEFSFQVANYVPVCGSSNETGGAIYEGNSLECDPAMATFNNTESMTNAAFYDLKGNILEADEAKIGGGEMRCLCLGLVHTNGRGIDSCLLLGKEGQAMERKNIWGDRGAVGLQGPEADLIKMLPSCKDYEAAIEKNKTSSGSGTSTSGGTVISGTPVAGETEKKSSGLATEAIIGIAVGLPGAILAVATMIVYLRKQRRKKAARYADVETGSAEKKGWKFWVKKRPAPNPVAAS